MSATQYLFRCQYELPPLQAGVCSMCGGGGYDLWPLSKALASTFTDQSHLVQGDGVCVACRWFLSGKSVELQQLLNKDKPQKPVNYSHIGVEGRWHIYSKAHKRQIAAHLCAPTLPMVCAIAESGQKHVVFKTKVNPPNAPCGWVNFEGEHVWLGEGEFLQWYSLVQTLYEARYTKSAILSGQYTFYPDSDVALWREIEPQLETVRGSLLFSLVVYLAQLSQEDKDDDQPKLDE